MWWPMLATSGVVVVAATAVICYLRHCITTLNRRMDGLRAVAGVAYEAGRADVTGRGCVRRMRRLHGPTPSPTTGQPGGITNTTQGNTCSGQSLPCDGVCG